MFTASIVDVYSSKIKIETSQSGDHEITEIYIGSNTIMIAHNKNIEIEVRDDR